MNSQRIVGIILLAAGVVLLVIGLNSSNSAVDRFSNAVTGRYTDNTLWYIGGGIVAGIAGLAMLVMNFRGKST